MDYENIAQLSTTNRNFTDLLQLHTIREVLIISTHTIDTTNKTLAEEY